MPSAKDYYDILGLDRKASADEVKKAYRKLAREHHPDMVKDSDKKGAETRFKEINEAYQVLSDPQKRQMYDQYGHAGVGQGQGAAGGGNPFGGNWGPFTYTYSNGGQASQGDFDPFDIFEDFFGFRGFSGQRRPRKGKNLYYELHIEFKDAVFGLEKEINVESGKVKVKIPAGVHSGTEVRFSGKGMPGPDGVPPGDLLLTLRVTLPKNFQRVGNTLITGLEVDMVQAALGDNIEVPIIDLEDKSGVGKAKIKIPSGTQHGTQIRLRGKGLPKLRGKGQGDLIVQVIVKIPKSLNRKQKKLLQEYMETL